MDNYIVRIYRREKDDPRLLVGLVEEVGTSGKRAFNTFDDLWEILNSVKNAERGSKRALETKYDQARKVKKK